MRVPPQTRPVLRGIDCMRENPEAFLEDQYACAEPGADGLGVSPSGYERCSLLRGPAQQMCYMDYF